MKNPKVSVIIPAYNAMDYLPETVESVLNQEFDDFEVVIVNDGSVDEIETWFPKVFDSRAKLISQENKGLAAARNTGILHAQGEYLAFLDADDLWDPSKLGKQVQILDRHPDVGLVYTWVSCINESGVSTGRVFKNCAEGDVWANLIEHNIVECGSVAMVRRTCLDTVGVFDENLTQFNVNEDWDMWLRIARYYTFKAIQEPLVYYRQRSSSASRNWKAMEQSFQLVIEKTFATAPPEMQYLKKKCYSFANLCLAWKPLQSKDKDYKQAIRFRQKALASDPRICFSKEFWRLSVAIAAIRWLGPNGYTWFLSFVHACRRFAVSIT